MKCFTFWENIKTISILDIENYGLKTHVMTRRNVRKQGWVFPLFSPDFDDQFSINFHRFVILYKSCDTRSLGLGQYCLPKVPNGFKPYKDGMVLPVYTSRSCISAPAAWPIISFPIDRSWAATSASSTDHPVLRLHPVPSLEKSLWITEEVPLF